MFLYSVDRIVFILYDETLTGLYCSIFAKIIAVSIYFRAVTQDEILPNNLQIPPKMLGYQIRM